MASPCKNTVRNTHTRIRYITCVRVTHLSRRIDDGYKLLQVPADEGIIQDPILVLETVEEGVLAQGVLARAELVVCALTLLLEVVDAIWESSGESKSSPFGMGEASAFVESGVGEDAVAV